MKGDVSVEAPPLGMRIGLRWTDGHQWFPFTVKELDDRGTLILERPQDSKGPLLAGFSLKHGGWEWKPAVECKFQKICPKCWGRGDVHKSETKVGARVICPRCKGRMLLNDPNPFNENRRRRKDAQ